MDEVLRMEGGGELHLCQTGDRAELTAVRKPDGRGLYKVWMSGPGENPVLLGTLAPENGWLRLRKVFPIAELRRQGCWPVRRARCILAFAFQKNSPNQPDDGWYCEPHPEKLLRDPELARQVHGPMLCSRQDTNFRLAAEFRTDKPVPLQSLICFVKFKKIRGKIHIIWDFTADGIPTIEKTTENRGD